MVKYYKNGTVFYTSSKAPTYPLMLDSWIGTVTAFMAAWRIARSGDSGLTS